MTAKTQQETEALQYDLRVIEHRTRKGELDPKEYEAYLKKLPDDEANAEYIEVYEEISVEEPTPHIGGPRFTSA
ncbi:MAG: hypothetical protein V2A66_05930 [Pseudomonadota bacterium]